MLRITYLLLLMIQLNMLRIESAECIQLWCLILFHPPPMVRGTSKQETPTPGVVRVRSHSNTTNNTRSGGRINKQTKFLIRSAGTNSAFGLHEKVRAVIRGGEVGSRYMVCQHGGVGGVVYSVTAALQDGVRCTVYSTRLPQLYTKLL